MRRRAARSTTAALPPPLAEQCTAAFSADEGTPSRLQQEVCDGLRALTEGGGTATFREGAKLTGGEFETKLAAAFKVIADDEDGHVDHATDDLNGVVETAKDFEAAKAALLEVSMQRLHMRNEMFSEPMSRAELDAYLTDRGGTPIEI